MSGITELRLTSVWEYSAKWCVFSGVPLVQNGFRSRSGKSIVVVKTHPEKLPLKPMAGQHWKVYGKTESRKAEHGDFVVTELHIEPERLEVTLPHDGEGFVRFLAKETDFKGIGEVKARELWHTFGADVFRLIESKDVGALESVLTTTAAQNLIEGYRKYANLKHSTWMADHHIPPQIQQRLFKYHGAESIDEIKANPFRLVSFGMALSKVDAIAKKHFGVSGGDERRLRAAVEMALRQHCARGGHTVAHHTDLSRRLRKILACDELVASALLLGHKSQAFYLNPETGLYHATNLLIMEKVVAKRLLSLNARPTVWGFEHDDAVNKAVADLPYPLMERQHEAVLTSINNWVSCITGGAGTGKTTVLRTVLKAYDELGFDIKAVALSGRAAMRLRESIGFETSTIAKFLKNEPLENEKAILVIDEASMVDLTTMYKLVLHMAPSVRILLVGDPHQLPPIGAGLVLADILKSGVIANVELDVVKRQDESSGIPEYSGMIRNGQVPESLSVGCIRFHEQTPDGVARLCAQLYQEDPSNSRMVAATRAMTGEINTLCQERFNADAPRLEFDEYGQRFMTKLLLNDPVLFTQNNYDAGVQNGSLGRLVSITQSDKHFGEVELDDGGSSIQLTKSLLDSLELGYAITLHKAQGSQFQRVIVALSESSMIDRAWLYTAISRAEVEIHIVGTRTRMVKAITSLSAHHLRKTYLSELLTNPLTVAAACDVKAALHQNATII